MLETFEKYTSELNDQERSVFPKFVEALSKHVGRANAISNSIMSQSIEVSMGVKIHGSRIRKMINIIQCQGLIPHLVSCGKGYYVAEDHDDVVRYVASIRARANSIYDVAKQVAIHEDVEDSEVAEYNKELLGIA